MAIVVYTSKNNSVIGELALLDKERLFGNEIQHLIQALENSNVFGGFHFLSYYLVTRKQNVGLRKSFSQAIYVILYGLLRKRLGDHREDVVGLVDTVGVK